MADKHISSQFDAELNRISTQVLEMGGVVEIADQQVLYALSQLSAGPASRSSRRGQGQPLEVQIDHELSSTMSRRQPTARDLRLLVGTSRIIINLERAGDEVCTVAKMLKSSARQRHAARCRRPSCAWPAAWPPSVAPRARCLRAHGRQGGAGRHQGRRWAIDVEHEGLTRKLLTYMMEDPRTISSGLNLMFLARAIERIGDHASNIAEAVIYIAKGADVRHTSEAEREAVVK